MGRSIAAEEPHVPDPACRSLQGRVHTPPCGPLPCPGVWSTWPLSLWEPCVRACSGPDSLPGSCSFERAPPWPVWPPRRQALL